MKTEVPLGVLAWEGPQLRAYLGRMALAGLKARHLVVVVPFKQQSRNWHLGRSIIRTVQQWYALKACESRHNYWPRILYAKHRGIINSIIRDIKALCPYADSMLDHIVKPINYEDYASSVCRIYDDQISGDNVAAYFKSLEPAVFLYTGGGILRSNVLRAPGIRFIHVHPGYLPHVRGADGFLWSKLVRNKIGLSAFYMDERIDEGQVISRKEYEFDKFYLGDIKRPDDKVLYRAIFSFCDPLLRAEFLVNEVLNKGHDLSSLPSMPQCQSEGTFYHFMNPRLRHDVLNELFHIGAPLKTI